MKKQWYAIYTKARNEKKVAELLTREGIENFLPLMKREKIWSDRRRIVEEPLFTSYIFVHIAEKEHLLVIRVPGVVCFVTFEKQKVPIRSQQIEAIKKYVETGEDITLDESEYTTGKKVRVISGSMKGLEGRLIKHLGHQRVRVEIDAIQHSIFIRIPMSMLEVI